MSTYSTLSSDSVYSTPGPQKYMLFNPGSGVVNKAQLLTSLRTQRVNTLTELRRIEKLSTQFDQQEFVEPLTSAFANYVNSHSLLNELRGLTKNYPFSSECLDEAKWMVIEDPASQRSWNYCWLALTKIQQQQLILKHANLMAAKPEMWGGHAATAAGVAQLSRAFVKEWNWALSQLLRHWDSPPTTNDW